MNDNKRNPDHLLQRIKAEETKLHHGKLKIYLGAAPGVGKTYSMLQDAIAKRAQGLDVVVGVVESHGRTDVDNLLKNLDILPRQTIDHRGKQLSEFDLDAAIKRNPGLILIDEMAHTNAPGLRHAKRWQDIKEILDLGIDVYTTLNIQHLESLNDVVSQIIHTRIKETVPDFMIELADTVELVDLPPEELIKRLEDGKVYIPQQAEIASYHFFRKGNLIALRELALRTTAERVSAQVLLYRQGEGIQYIWPTRDKLLVCVGSRPGSAKIIRATKRLAASLQAEWFAVHVDTPKIKDSETLRTKSIQNLRLAEQLGAQTKILTGTDIATEIVRFAHEQNITKIVIGKKIRPRWRDFLFVSLADDIIRHSGEIDVFAITGEDSDSPAIEPIKSRSAFPWKIYGIALTAITIATGLGFTVYPFISSTNTVMIYLLAVTIVALFGKTGPAVFASVLSAICYGFFFIPPYYTLNFYDIGSVFTLLVILIVSQIISHLTILTRRQAEAAHSSEQRTAALHTLSRQLANTRGVDKLLQISVRYIAELVDSEVLALLPEGSHLKVKAGFRATLTLSEKEFSVAQWVYDLGQVAGLGTDTLPFSDAVYVPLLASQETIGVLRIRPSQKVKLFSPEQMHLLEACATQIATAIEVDRLQEKNQVSEVRTEAHKVHNALLQSVSHDLRAPIVAIMGAASTLNEMSQEIDPTETKRLANDIIYEGEQINRLINNLLQITYLEAETVKLQKKLHALKNTINHAIKALHPKVDKKSIHFHIDPDLPKIPFDSILMQEVFVNLIDNAIKFTASESPIDITASIQSNRIIISVEDRGPGIMPDEVKKLFEKYYRGRMLTTEHGLGLGLAICRNIVKAHGGEIWAENRPDGGASFRFWLPLDK